MIEYEADDAIATAAAYCSGLDGVEQVVICSPDKDLAQMVRGESVVCYDRRRETVMGETGVIEKFGQTRTSSIFSGKTKLPTSPAHSTML